MQGSEFSQMRLTHQPPFKPAQRSGEERRKEACSDSDKKCVQIEEKRRDKTRRRGKLRHWKEKGERDSKQNNEDHLLVDIVDKQGNRAKQIGAPCPDQPRLTLAGGLCSGRGG